MTVRDCVQGYQCTFIFRHIQLVNYRNEVINPKETQKQKLLCTSR